MITINCIVYIRYRNKENKMLKIIEWNLNQRTQKCNLDLDFISKSLNLNSEEIADILLFTEVTKQGNYSEFKFLLEINYNIFTSSNEKGQNDILIAIKKDISIIENSLFSFYCTSIKNHQTNDIFKPNFLSIDIEIEKKKITIGCARIRIGNYKKYCDSKVLTANEMKSRLQQNNYILNYIKNKEYVIILGDFNTNRRFSPRTDYSMVILQDLYEAQSLIVNTPTGASVGRDDLFMPLDHIITNMQCYKYVYSRSFTSYKPDIYLNDKDLIGIKQSYPDHAILISEFDI